MRHALTILACSLLLAACGSNSGNQDTASSAPASAPTPAATATPAGTAASPASAPTAAASSAPADDTSTDTASSDSASGGLTAAERAQAQAIYQRGVGKWTEGKQYNLISPPQPTAYSGSKVEVLEVFSWGCPFCNVYHPAVDDMAKSLPSFAAMSYLPASFNPQENWPLYQRVFFAARALGVADKSYDAVFDATWKSGELATYNLGGTGLKPPSDWPKLDDFARFYAKHYGIDAKQFEAVANSFSVNTQMKRADELIKSYGVGGTPTFIVDGQYRFDFRSAGSKDNAKALAIWLAAKAALNK